MRTFTFLEGLLLLFVSVSIGSASNLRMEGGTKEETLTAVIDNNSDGVEGTLATVIDNNSDGVEGTLAAVIDNPTGRIIEFRVNLSTESISGVLRIANERFKPMEDPAIYFLTKREGSLVWLEAASIRDFHLIDGRVYFLRRQQGFYWREHYIGSGTYAAIGIWTIRKSKNDNLVILNGEQYPLLPKVRCMTVACRNGGYNPDHNLSLRLDGYCNIVVSTLANVFDRVHFEKLCTITMPTEAFNLGRDLNAAFFVTYTSANVEKIQESIFEIDEKIILSVFKDGVRIDASQGFGSKATLRRYGKGHRSTYTILSGKHAISKVFHHPMRNRPTYMDLCIITSLF